MRILLLVDSYLPDPKATGPMFYALSQELRQRGHEVTILTISDKITGYCEFANEAGVRVVRVRSPKMKNIGLVRRAIQELTLSRLVWFRARAAIESWRADLLAFYSPTIFWGPLVRRLKHLWGCRTVLILRDIFPQWAIDAEQMRIGPHRMVFDRYARIQYRAADRIGVQSPNNLEYFQKRLPRYLSKAGVLFNWTAELESGVEDPRPALGLTPGTPILLYGGNIGSAQDPELLLAAARELQGRSAFLLIIGEGLAVGKVQRAIAEEKLTNVAFWPSVPQQRFLAIAHACDAGVIALNPKLTTHNFPGKLLTYISAGLPVLASINRGNDLRDVLEETNAGLCNWADEPQQFLANALTLLNHQQTRAAFAANVRTKLASRFSVAQAAEFLLA
jgi:glycosyltransferase involved in cell wall biosynthesis